jgi:hypothetical protein
MYKSEDFHRDVLFLSIEDATHTPFPEPVKYGEVARLGRAMIDPHCPINIVSKEFFERLNTPFIEFSALEKERPFFRTILNEEVRMLGQSRISWRLANSQPRRSGTDNFKFKNGFTESTFYIFDTRLFNCIIGSATINQHQLATCVAAPAFYCYPPKISECKYFAHVQASPWLIR